MIIHIIFSNTKKSKISFNERQNASYDGFTKNNIDALLERTEERR